MKLEEVFVKYKYLIVCFFITFLAFVFCYYKSKLCLFFDIPAMFLGMFFGGDEKSYYIFHDNRPRFFNNFLVSIPFNILFQILKDKAIIYSLSAFASSYFIIHFVGLVLNFFVATRTKRYDVAIIAFAFYTFFILPNAVWACREVHMTTIFQFVLLSYFLAKEKFKTIDYVLITLLIVYMFGSFETIVPFGILLLVASYFYSKKKEVSNAWSKIYIGFGTFGAACYTVYNMLFGLNLHFDEGISRWIYGSISTLESIFKSNLIITFFGLLALIFIAFYKKIFDRKSTFFIISFIVIMVGILYRATNAFTVDPNREMHFYSLTFWFLFPVIFTILFLDFKNINVSEINKAFYSNLLIIACLIGFCNLAWQFYSCYQHKHYLWHIKYLFNNSENVLVNIPREDYQNHKFMRFDTCFGKLQKSVFLSDEYVVKKLLYPLEYDGTYSEFCYEKIDGTYYDTEKDVLTLQRAPLKVKTKYWDLTPIVEEFKKQGMLNSIENQQH